MRAEIRLVAACVGALVLVSCGGREEEASAPDPEILARVGAVEIRAADVQAEIDRRRAAKRPVPSKEALLAEMVELEILVQRAVAEGIAQDAEVRRTYRNLLVGKLKDAELRPQLESASVSDDEIAAFYDSHLEDYRVPAKVRLGVIFIKVDSGASEERRAALLERAETVRRMALDPTSPEGFRKAAMSFSDDQASRYKGGDMGWIEEEKEHARIPEAVVATGFALKEPGETSEVLRGEQGYHVARLLDRAAGSTIPLTRVAERIRAQLLREKRAAISEQFSHSLREGASVETFPGRLDAVVLPDVKEKETGPPKL